MENLKAKIKEPLYISAFFSFTVLFFGPGHIYYYNILEYNYTFLELIFTLFVSSLSLTALITAVLLLVSRLSRLFQVVVSVLFIVSFLIWLQGTVLVWDYGLFKGAAIDWESKSHYGYIDSGIWAVLLIFAIIKPRIVRKLAVSLSFVLIMVQLTSLIILSYQSETPYSAIYEVNKTEKYKFSSKKNVVLLVLDTFSTDIFNKLVNNDVKYRDIFDGFTYFPDSVGGYPSTYPSMPLILTGQYYDNSVPFRDFLRESFTSNSIPRVLKDLGYHVYLPKTTYLYSHPSVSSVIERKKMQISLKFDEFLPLLDLTLFRDAPHFVKKFVFDEEVRKPYVVKNLMDIITGTEEEKRLSRDIVFMREMLSESETGIHDDVFKFYHLRGIHEPFRLNERLEYEEMEVSPSSATIQAIATLKITEEFLNTLKRIGIYDNTLLIVIGDHGSGTPEWPSQVAGEDMSYLAPLVLIKPFGARGMLKVSEKPVALVDIPKTVFGELNLDVEVPGDSMFDPEARPSRKRRYLSYSLSTWAAYGRLSRKLYLPPMKEYLVDKNSWTDDSWELMESIFEPENKIVPGNRYTYGEPVRFGSKGDAYPYQKHGWANSVKYDDLTYTIGKRPSMSFTVVNPESDMLIKAVLSPVTMEGRLRSHRVIVWVNGNREGTWNVEKDSQYTLVVPREHVSDRVDIVFELPDAKSPADAMYYKDYRPLSIVFKSVVLSEQ